MKESTCVDPRPWAKERRYRWRFEESFYAEKAERRGDGRWYVEILCHNGLIYPFGGQTLLAYAKAGVKKQVAELPDTKHHQIDGNAEVFKFPLECLDEVAAILKPKRLRGTATPTAKQRETLQKHAFKGGQTAKEQLQSERNDQSAIQPLALPSTEPGSATKSGQ